jgi:hypothetical protein
VWTVSGNGVSRVAAAAVQGRASGPVSRVRPGPRRSRVERRWPSDPADPGPGSRGSGSQVWRRRWLRSSARASGAVRPWTLLGRAGGAADADGTPFGLVGVEQLGAGPALVDPGQLPGQVVGLGHGGVHAHPAAWGHALGGVAGQEHAARPVAVGDLGGERERALGHDPDRQVPDAAGGADEAGQAGVGVVREPFPARVPFPPVQPAVADAVGDQDAGGLRVLDEVDAVAAVAGDLGQRRLEQHGDQLAEVVGAGHGNAEQAPDQ